MITLRALTLLLSLTLSSLTLMGQSVLNSIPNQKKIDGSYVSNPDQILNASTIAQIDSLLTALEKSKGIQISIVALNSIGEEDVFTLAQELFSNWGIGSKSRDEGLLILLVKDQRTIRFHTGYGLEGQLPDVVCKRIQRDYMLPHFKNNDYDAGMLAGVQQVLNILQNPASADVEVNNKEQLSDYSAFLLFLAIFFAPVIIGIFIYKQRSGKFANASHSSPTPYPAMRLPRWRWLLQVVFIPLAIITFFGLIDDDNAVGLCILTLYGYAWLTLFLRLIRMQEVIKPLLQAQDYYAIVEFLRKQTWYWLIMGLLFPLPFLGYFFYHLARRRMYRNHPRQCKQCQGNMKKLTEQEDDAYLSAAQQVEEKIKSVDYDVWKCVACDSIEVWYFLNKYTQYEPCPKCKTIAYTLISNKTLKSASYAASGTGEKIHACQFCGYEKKSTYSIPILVRSASSSGISGGSRSSGSWGGGRSGGGGASSSW